MNNLINLKNADRAMIAEATERYLASQQIAVFEQGATSRISGKEMLRNHYVITSPANRKPEPPKAKEITKRAPSRRCTKAANLASFELAVKRRQEFAPKLRAYAEAGHSVSEAAREFGMSRKTVRKIAAEAGITFRSGVTGK